VLSELFGRRVLRYFDSACEVSDQAHRIAMCNLAAFDSGVVLAHHANRKVIGGRHGRLFTSVFFVQGPVDAEAIRDVYAISHFDAPTPHVSLDRLL